MATLDIADLAPLPRARRKFPVGDIVDRDFATGERIAALLRPEEFDEPDALDGEPDEDDSEAADAIYAMLQEVKVDPAWLGGLSINLERLLRSWADEIDGSTVAFNEIRTAFHFTIQMLRDVLPELGDYSFGGELEFMSEYLFQDIDFIVSNAWATMKRSHPNLYALMWALREALYAAYSVEDDLEGDYDLLVDAPMVLVYLLSSWNGTWELREQIRWAKKPSRRKKKKYKS